MAQWLKVLCQESSGPQRMVHARITSKTKMKVKVMIMRQDLPLQTRLHKSMMLYGYVQSLQPLAEQYCNSGAVYMTCDAG